MSLTYAPRLSQEDAEKIQEITPIANRIYNLNENVVKKDFDNIKYCVGRCRTIANYIYNAYIPIENLLKQVKQLNIKFSVSCLVKNNISKYKLMELLEYGYGLENMIRYIIDHNLHKYTSEFNDNMLSKVNINISRKMILRKIIDYVRNNNQHNGKEFIMSKKFFVNNIKWIDYDIITLYIESLYNCYKDKQFIMSITQFMTDIKTYENIHIIKNPAIVCQEVTDIINNIHIEPCNG